ncbi:hypothetical protein EIP86_002819 [Pleurotus ostreatoroseus]|nr:hypothetical protein EIP86_002819 [Pleurotus ostreatoroseus]
MAHVETLKDEALTKRQYDWNFVQSLTLELFKIDSPTDDSQESLGEQDDPVSTVDRWDAAMPNENNRREPVTQTENARLNRPHKSSYPPSASVNLRIRLGKRLGYGASGRVHAVEIVQINPGTVPEGKEWHVPELVAKVANQGNEPDLQNELYFYEENMELQGRILARCYGLYHGTIPEKYSAMSLPKFKGPKLENRILSDPQLYDEWKKYPGDNYEERELCTATGDATILLLERLGPRIKAPIESGLSEDLIEMYGYLAANGTDHHDFSCKNILRAPLSPPGLPSLPMPETNKIYNWRITDFGLAYKSIKDESQFQKHHESGVRQIINDANARAQCQVEIGGTSDD